MLNIFYKKTCPTSIKQAIYVKRYFLTAKFPELSLFPKTIQNYENLHKFSIENQAVFWGTLAKSRLEWYQEFKKVTEGTFNDENFNLKWFIDGKLNVSGKIFLFIAIDNFQSFLILI